MTDKQFLECYLEVENYQDRDAYVSDMALSTIWDDATDSGIPADRIQAIGDIWDAVHRSVKDIAADAGISQRKLAERFCIPYRTVEDWCAGRRECAAYIKMMMQECLGLLNR